MLGYKSVNSLTDAEIEEKARDLGMHTDEDCKVFFRKDGE